MLLEFKAKNYKSFKDEFNFSLVPAPKQKDLSYSVLGLKAGNKVYKGLCSAVIYGPNASGKTNIIGAMDVFKTIVLRGNIHNGGENKSPNEAANILELIPNNTLKNSEPVFFSIKFIVDNLLVEYEIAIDLGKFLDDTYPRKVLKESLYINESMIYVRSNDILFGELDKISKYLATGLEQNIEVAKELAINNLNNTELFLINGFKNMFSSKLVFIITQWLEKTLLLFIVLM